MLEMLSEESYFSCERDLLMFLVFFSCLLVEFVCFCFFDFVKFIRFNLLFLMLFMFLFLFCRLIVCLLLVNCCDNGIVVIGLYNYVVWYVE